MPTVYVRSATAADIPFLVQIDASYTTTGIWRPDALRQDDLTGISFREMRLPRSVRVAYPRALNTLPEEWTRLDGLLVAVVEEQMAGFIVLLRFQGFHMAWVRDLVVAAALRQRGIGSALLLAGLQWAQSMRAQTLTLEMQTRNLPAIRLAQKLDFTFAGYHEHYYAPQESALFFVRKV
ncbi:MAG: hypothetical protein Fur0018_02450 [Anaerolineales bacterium]